MIGTHTVSPVDVSVAQTSHHKAPINAVCVYTSSFPLPSSLH